MADASAGKIPTWAMVLGTGIGLVFYAQREFVPRSESNLLGERRNEQVAVLTKRDEELAKAIKDIAVTLESSQKQTLQAVQDHASTRSHAGTAEQNAAILQYLAAQQSNQRQIYSVVQSVAQKLNVPAPPLVEVQVPQPSFQR